MKKLFNVFFALFFIMGIMGCANSIGPDTSEGALEDNMYLIKENVPNSNRVDIFRKNITKGEEYYTYNIYLNDNSKTGFIDYFVNPNDIYEYSFTYYNTNERDENGNWKVLKKSVFKKNAKKGVGELVPEIQPIATFDNTTAMMHFTTLPKFSSEIDRFIRNNRNFSMNFYMYYRLSENNRNWDVMRPSIREYVDCASAIADWNGSNEEYLQTLYNKDLKFSKLEASVWIDGISYNQQSSCGNFPETINVKDTRIPLEVQEVTDGVKISVPDSGISATSQYLVDRYVVKSDNSIVYDNYYFNTTNKYDLTKKELFDYFVDNTKKYVYKLSFRDNNGNNLKTTKFSNPIICTTGKGELELKSEVKVNYDSTTGIMTFNPKPNLKEQLNKITTDVKKEPRFSLGYENPKNNNWLWGYINFENGQINWPEVISKNGNSYETDKYYNQDLVFQRIDIEPIIDNVYYRKGINKEEVKQIIPDFKDTLKIPDVRKTLEVKQATNGIEILIPNEKPNGINQIVVDRKDVQTGKTEDFYIYTNSIDKTSLIDYFVEPGKSYQYKLRFRNNSNGNINFETKYSNEITANAGIKELVLNCNPAVSYDEKTGIMKFDPKPDFSELYNKLNNIVGQNVNKWINMGLSYSLPNNSSSVYGNYNSEYGEINWSDVLNSNSNSSNYYNTDLILNRLQISAMVDTVSYETEISRNILLNMIPNFPEKIRVPNLSIPVEFNALENGIEIKIPAEPVKGTERISIDRRNPDTGAWDWFDLRDLTKTSVMDYFVTNGKTYEYRLRYRNQQGYDIKTTRYYSVKANGGMGDITLQQNPVVEYDANTGIMKFTTLPKLSTEYENLFTNGNINFCICYGKNSNGWEVMCPNVKETIDCREAFHHNSLDYLGKNIYLISFFVDMYSNDGMLYRFDLPLDLIPDELHTIVVPAPTK